MYVVVVFILPSLCPSLVGLVSSSDYLSMSPFLFGVVPVTVFQLISYCISIK